MARVKFLGIVSNGAIRLGGANPVDGDTVTIGPVPAVGGVTGKRFEFDDDVAVTAGNILVDIKASATLSAVALKDAINANKTTPAGVTAFIDPIDPLTVRLQGDFQGAAGNLALAETFTDGSNIVSGAGLVAGENAGNQTFHRGAHTVTALDISAGSAQIPTGLQGPRFRNVDVYSSTGLQRNDLTDLFTFVGDRLQVDIDGATNIVAGDVISWIAFE